MDMKKNGKVYPILVLAIGLYLLTSGVKTSHAADIVFDDDLNYTIYYKVSEFEVDAVKNVRIVGVMSLGNVPFLAFTGTGPAAKDREGYVALHAIKAILPAPYIKPDRTFAGK